MPTLRSRVRRLRLRCLLALQAGTGAAWSVCKTMALIVGDALEWAKDRGLRFLGGAFRYIADVTDTLAGPVTVDDIETIVYLDDSGSMWEGVFGARLAIGSGCIRSGGPVASGANA